MSPLGKSQNLAARMGRWSASHKKTAIFGWLAFVAAAFVIGNVVGTKQLDPDKSGSGESGRVDSILADDFKQPAGDTILIQSSSTTADDPAFRAAVTDVMRSVARLGSVKTVDSPFAAGNEGQISQDRHTALVTLELRTTDDKKAETLDVPVQKTIAAAADRHPGIAIEEVGVNAETQINDAVSKDFAKAGMFSLPVTLAVLVLAFGALVAAGLPLLLALTAVFATLGLLAIPSQLVPLDENVSVIVLLIGLAVGVDYSMFYLKREREERAAGRSERAALEAAAATSGRAVLISGLTVMVAMAGMLFTGDKMFMGFGLATMFVVAVAVLGSLTVLPATLAALGDKVDKVRVPFLHRLRRRDGEGRMWSAILDRVLRRPLVFAGISAALLLALAAPALHMHTGQPGNDTLPQNLPAVQTLNKLDKAFPGGPIAASVLVKTADAKAPAVQSAIAELQRKALASGQFNTPTDVSYNDRGAIALVSLPIQGDGQDAKSNAALQNLRDTIIPATVGTISGAEVGVTGQTAQSKDFNDQMKGSAPIVFAFVLGLTFVLLTVVFRSVAIAATAVFLNLLSVGAAYGLLVLVFQHGAGAGLLGFQEADTIEAWVPLFLFAVLFGLSMDYQVFLLSRIRERYDTVGETRAAVSWGVSSTARIITGAALIIVAVFLGFAMGDLIQFQQMGFGVAVALLLDATIIRSVILPSLMALLGRWNWYLPGWLGWLPEVRAERSA